MQIDIQPHDFTLTDRLQLFIRDQAKLVMGPYAHRIVRLVVRLRNINSADGRTNQQCCVEVKLARQPNVIVISKDVRPENTVRDAISRAGKMTRRQLRRRRTGYLRSRNRKSPNLRVVEPTLAG